MEVVNLNTLISRVVMLDDTELMQTILNCTLQPKYLLELVRETKKYSYLPLFMSFIPDNEENDDLLTMIVVDALEQGISLKDELYDKLYNKSLINNVTREAGKRGISYSKLEAMYSNLRYDYYVIGLIIADRDDLIPHHSTEYTSGYYCAKKCMTKLGFNPEKLKLYLRGALKANRKETIEFLHDYDLNAVFRQLVLLQGTLCFEQIIFGLNQGLTLDAKTYDILEVFNPELYKQLQDDI